MDNELKEMLGDKKRLEEILEIGRIQAWRLWEGRSQLTKANEKLIRLELKNESGNNQ
ncbi:hypothetical protein [Vibrio phage vB_VpM-pA2SJ1]|uniref:Uncharacterized protein n=1 Tax=Vibrio phage vB_VpM-pA2SJ1 TaxID=3095964 RepID=A0AAX4J5Q8_9CAUD